MNELTILAIVLSTAVYCESTRNCNITEKLYKTDIKVNCSNSHEQLNRFSTISSYLVGYVTNINGRNFKLKFQVAASNHHCTIDNVIDINTIMGEFTPICQRYTDVMAHKFYLQHLLFHRANEATVLIQLVSVVTNLQILANSLQTIQMKEDNGRPCVRFAPCQYKKIYYSRLPMNISSDELDSLCLLKMAARNWQIKDALCIR